MPKDRSKAKRKSLKENAQVQRDSRSRREPQEQLEALDARLGIGRGARRERERLHEMIAGGAE